MFMATFLVMSGMLFYLLLKPPHSKKKTKPAEVSDGRYFEKSKPMLLKDTYSAQEAKSSV